MTIIAYIVGLIGMLAFCDGLASLYTYTGNNPKAKGQSWKRDHSLRMVRLAYGVVLIWLGAKLLGIC